MSDYPPRLTSIVANIHARPGEIAAEHSLQNPSTVWLRFGDFGSHASLFLSLDIIADLRRALDVAEGFLTPEPAAPEPEPEPVRPPLPKAEWGPGMPTRP